MLQTQLFENDYKMLPLASYLQKDINSQDDKVEPLKVSSNSVCSFFLLSLKRK